MFEFLITNFWKIILTVSGVALSLFIFKNFHRIRRFIGEVVVELGKVSWATREELFTATWVVIISTAMLAAYIFVIDSALSKILSLTIR
ncbi:MAG: preprotein translocase subunit SecE [Candidatus Omnitrophota bacterium]